MKTLFYISFIVWLTACNNSDSVTTERKKTDTLSSSNKIDTVDRTTKTNSPQTIFQDNKIITANFNDDNLVDTIVLSISSKDKNSFNNISVSLTGFGRQTFKAQEAWTTVDSAFLKTNKNLISSNELFIKKVNGQTVLLLFGGIDGAGYREEFSIINIVNNKVQMVFDHLENYIDVEIPTTLADLDNDGKLDFVFTSYCEQAPPPDNFKDKGVFESYCPFLVYTVYKDCNLNETLTKKYNEDKYVFAGFKYSEEIEVFIPANGGQKRACKRDKDGRLIWLTK